MAMEVGGGGGRGWDLGGSCPVASSKGYSRSSLRRSLLCFGQKASRCSSDDLAPLTPWLYSDWLFGRRDPPTSPESRLGPEQLT